MNMTAEKPTYISEIWRPSDDLFLAFDKYLRKLPVAKSLPFQPVASYEAWYGSLNMEDPDEVFKTSHHPTPGA